MTLSLSPWERDRYGVIATCREQETGEVRCVVRPGSTNEALALIAEEIAAAAGDWRIIVLSTPRTIYRDLQGARGLPIDDGRGGMRAPDLHQTEKMLLGKVRLLHLLEPWLLAEISERDGGRRQRR